MPEEVPGYPRIRTLEGHEQPRGCWKLNTPSPQEQQVLSAFEPFLCTPVKCFSSLPWCAVYMSY